MDDEMIPERYGWHYAVDHLAAPGHVEAVILYQSLNSAFVLSQPPVVASGVR